MTDTQLSTLLDDRAAQEKFDTNHTLTTIEQIGNQITQVWAEAAALKFDDSYRKVRSVVVAGMGGSILGTDVIQSVFKEHLSVPVSFAPDYTVPSFVGEDTLVIASSYSGNTEETVSAATDALAKGAVVTGITSGGKLSQLLSEHNCPHLQFETEFNPSGSARMGLGYSIFGQMALLHSIGLLSLSEDEYQAVITTVADMHLQMSVAIPQDVNPAKLLAFHLFDHIPCIMAAEHLAGSAHVFANQLNENAKTYAEFRVIPEMNHHLLEGFHFPKTGKISLFYVSLHSELYHPSNSTRIKLTEELLEKHEIEFVSHSMKAPTALSQAFEAIMLGAYTAYYLSMLYGQNPVSNENVDWLKANL